MINYLAMLKHLPEILLIMGILAIPAYLSERNNCPNSDKSKKVRAFYEHF